MGYCLHANGFQFPLHIPGDYTTKSPAELWDQVPTNGKLQILGFVAFLEFFGELDSYCTGGVSRTRITRTTPRCCYTRFLRFLS